jgi:hypothetical protein
VLYHCNWIASHVCRAKGTKRAQSLDGLEELPALLCLSTPDVSPKSCSGAAGSDAHEVDNQNESAAAAKVEPPETDELDEHGAGLGCWQER